MRTGEIIPIFWACDRNFVKYTIVSLRSAMANASKENRYKAYILHTDIEPEMQEQNEDQRAERQQVC